MTSTTHAPRRWISAADSFAVQPAALAGMPEHLAGQLAAAPARPGRATVVGIGASYAAAAAGVHRMRAHGVDATRHLPGELPRTEDLGLVIAASQSGRSAEVVELGRSVPAERLVAVTNYHPSPLGDLAGHVVNLGDHADSSVSFLSFNATQLAFGMLADHWAGQLDLARWLAVTEAAVAGALAATADLDRAAETLAGGRFIDVAAPVAMVGAAEEAALMFREGPRIAATGMETRHYLHGPMDVAGAGAHLVFGGEREALLVEQLAEQTDRLVYVAISPDAPRALTAPAVTLHLDIPGQDPVGQAVGATIMAQYLALKVSEIRDVDIDEPVFTRLDTKTDTAR